MEPCRHELQAGGPFLARMTDHSRFGVTWWSSAAAAQRLWQGRGKGLADQVFLDTRKLLTILAAIMTISRSSEARTFH